MLLFGTQVTQNSRFSGGVHPQECVPTESWWVVGWCGRLIYLLDCRFLRMASARILYVRHSSHCKVSSFSCIRNQRSACVQAESVDWYGSVSSNLEEFVGFDWAWLGVLEMEFEFKREPPRLQRGEADLYSLSLIVQSCEERIFIQFSYFDVVFTKSVMIS